MEKETLLKILKALAIASSLYFIGALFFYLLMVLGFLFNLKITEGAYLFIFENFGETILGLLIIGFLVIFVSTILVQNKLQNTNENIKSGKFIKMMRIFVVVCMIIGVFIFVRTDGIVEGTPGTDGDRYVVTYRGEFVKEISEAQYYEYSNMKYNSGKILIVSVVLFFTGMIFFSLADSYIQNKNSIK